MTKPLGGFQPPSDTMLWGSQAGGQLCFAVLCFVFRGL